ncbi:MAG: DUF4876 domain-containing protein, partial [Bacteroidaceae bacterium]|nr:DUF4876 domain-containing protein [Bacteroidaceae bacterium]
MKKFLSMIAAVALLLAHTACTNEEEDYRTYSVAVQLLAPEVTDVPIEGITVTATGQTGTALNAITNQQGIAEFMLPEDIYIFTASHKISADGTTYTVNYKHQQTITKQDFASNNTLNISIAPVVSKGGSQVILKEIYVGGCPKDDGSGNYQYDKYVVIYNNSSQVANIRNFCISNAGPYNAHTSINNYVDGQLAYADQGYTPAYAYMFYMTKDLVMQPYSSATIALTGAIDHTVTYANSVDLSNADYVCYDPEDFWNTNYHPTPSSNIPSDNYMLASKFCLANQNATSWSMIGPGIFIFSTADKEPLAYTQDETNRHYMPGKENNAVYAGA